VLDITWYKVNIVSLEKENNGLNLFAAFLYSREKNNAVCSLPKLPKKGFESILQD
jgi:hypothetical protein